MLLASGTGREIDKFKKKVHKYMHCKRTAHIFLWKSSE